MITLSKPDALFTTISRQIPPHCDPIIRDSLETSGLPRVAHHPSSVVDRREHFPRHLQVILSNQ